MILSVEFCYLWAFKGFLFLTLFKTLRNILKEGTHDLTRTVLTDRVK